MPDTELSAHSVQLWRTIAIPPRYRLRSLEVTHCHLTPNFMYKKIIYKKLGVSNRQLYVPEIKFVFRHA